MRFRFAKYTTNMVVTFHFGTGALCAYSSYLSVMEA